MIMMAACVREPGSVYSFSTCSLFSFMSPTMRRQLVYGKRIGSPSIACLVITKNRSTDYTLRLGKMKVPFFKCVRRSLQVGLGDCDVYTLRNGDARRIIRYLRRAGIETNPTLKLPVNVGRGFTYIATDKSVIRRSYEDSFLCSCGHKLIPKGIECICGCGKTYAIKAGVV